MKKPFVAALGAGAALLMMAVPAAANHDTNPSKKVANYQYDVDRVPHPATTANAAVDGTIRVTALPGDKVHVKIRLTGLAPNLPHAQHLHGAIPGTNTCPSPDVAGPDGLISVLDAAPNYGPIQISLTTTGDTSADSALAVSRFPVADANGNLSYDRTFTVPSDVHDSLGTLHYVVHGIDLNGNGAYDFDAAGASEIAPTLPFEATVPAGCAG